MAYKTKNRIKALIELEETTMSELVEKLADEYQWSYSLSNFSRKLSSDTIRFKEVQDVADALGYEIQFIKIE